MRETYPNWRHLAHRQTDEIAQLNHLIAELKSQLAERPPWRPFVIAFARAILHGDDEHRAWLLEAAEAFVAGRPLPVARGGGIAAKAVCEGSFCRMEHDDGDRARAVLKDGTPSKRDEG